MSDLIISQLKEEDRDFLGWCYIEMRDSLRNSYRYMGSKEYSREVASRVRESMHTEKVVMARFAEMPTQFVGFAIGTPADGELSYLYVKKVYRGCCYGKEILAELFRDKQGLITCLWPSRDPSFMIMAKKRGFNYDPILRPRKLERKVDA
jgi:hypothetical protein